MCQAMAATAASPEKLCSEQTLAQKHTAQILLYKKKSRNFSPFTEIENLRECNNKYV